MTFELMTDPCMLLYSQGIWIAGVMPQLGLDAEQWENCCFDIIFSNMCIHVVFAENPHVLLEQYTPMFKRLRSVRI